VVSGGRISSEATASRFSDRKELKPHVHDDNAREIGRQIADVASGAQQHRRVLDLGHQYQK
jgi:hypothetical protein